MASHAQRAFNYLFEMSALEPIKMVDKDFLLESWGVGLGLAQVGFSLKNIWVFPTKRVATNQKVGGKSHTKEATNRRPEIMCFIRCSNLLLCLFPAGNLQL